MSAEKVKFKITSVIEELDDGGMVESSDRTETIVSGELAKRGERALISYSETSEGGDVHSDIIVCESSVIVKRQGAVNSRFVFAEGETHASLYSVGPYSFDAEVFTRKIRNEITRGGSSLSLIYDMTVGGAKKSVRMKIEVQGL